MPARKLILVLVIPESGLRSTIAARMALAGASVITVDGLEGQMVERQARRGAMLIIDEAMLAPDMRGMRAVQPWNRVVVLTGDVAGRSSDDDWLVYLDRRAAADLLLGLLTTPV